MTKKRVLYMLIFIAALAFAISTALILWNDSPKKEQHIGVKFIMATHLGGM